MNKTHVKIISFLIALIAFPFLGYLINELLLILKIINDYGYIGSSYFEWLYNIFYHRDGLYDYPNLIFSVSTFILTFLMIFKLWIYFKKLGNKT